MEMSSSIFSYTKEVKTWGGIAFVISFLVGSILLVSEKAIMFAFVICKLSYTKFSKILKLRFVNFFL